MECTTSEYTADLFVGGDVLRAGVFFTHWEPWLSHRFTFLGITSVLFCALVCLLFWGGGGRFLLWCVAWLVDWFSRFINMGCTSTSSYPWLSQLSRWAQQWSKKKMKWNSHCGTLPRSGQQGCRFLPIFWKASFDPVHPLLNFGLMEWISTQLSLSWLVLSTDRMGCWRSTIMRYRRRSLATSASRSW